MTNQMRSFFLASTLLVVTLAAQAQNVVSSNFGLRPSGSSSQRVVSLGDSKSRVIQVLGPPTKTSRFYDEIDEVWGTILHYGNNQLVFSKDELGIIELNDPRLTVGKPGTAGFHVGSGLPKMPPAARAPLAFGTFRVTYQPGRSRNLNYNAISFGNMKTTKGQVLDVLYEILYDQQGRVAHIFLDQTYD